MTVSEIFKAIRKAHGLNQRNMAIILEMSPAYISNIEIGANSNPTYEALKKLIFNLGANPLFVFGIDTTVPPIMHPAIIKERLSGKKDVKIKKEILDRIEADLHLLKSFKD